MHASLTTSRTPRPLLRPLVAAVVLALGGTSGAQAQSLSELFVAARDHDASYLSAVANAKATRAKGDQAWAGVLPQVNFRATENKIDPGNSSYDSDSQTLSIKQPLFQVGSFLGLEQGAHTRDIADRQHQAAEQDLVIRITQAYFDVLSASDSVTVVQAQKQAVSEQLAAAKRNFEVGTSTVTDSREAQARFDLVVAQEIAAQNDLRVKRLALEQLVGISDVQPKALKVPVALPNLEPMDLQAWLDQAQANNAQLQQAKSGKDIASLESKKAMSNHLPTLDLEAVRSKNFNSQNSNLRNNTDTISLVLNVPLFAGFAHHNRIRETLHLQDKAQADLDNAQRGVVQATRSAFFGVQAGMSQVKALEAAEASSQVSLDANKLGYQVGVRINIDVLNAQTQLYQTKRDLSQARYNVLLGQLRLKQASGKLTGQDLQAINDLLAP
ncbi:MAG: TolC family outer membrane protein [Hydrogenophaga sp.]